MVHARIFFSMKRTCLLQFDINVAIHKLFHILDVVFSSIDIQNFFQSRDDLFVIQFLFEITCAVLRLNKDNR